MITKSIVKNFKLCIGLVKEIVMWFTMMWSLVRRRERRLLRKAVFLYTFHAKFTSPLIHCFGFLRFGRAAKSCRENVFFWSFCGKEPVVSVFHILFSFFFISFLLGVWFWCLGFLVSWLGFCVFRYLFYNFCFISTFLLSIFLEFVAKLNIINRKYTYILLCLLL